jgi:hypothetical protein
LIDRRSDRFKAKKQERKQKKNARISRCTFAKVEITIDEDVMKILSSKKNCETAATTTTTTTTIRKIASS